MAVLETADRSTGHADSQEGDGNPLGWYHKPFSWLQALYATGLIVVGCGGWFYHFLLAQAHTEWEVEQLKTNQAEMKSDIKETRNDVSEMKGDLKVLLRK